jgi:signal transduction histidine kinase
MGNAVRKPAAANPASMWLVGRRENSLLSLFELSHELSVGLDPYAIAQLTLFSLMGHFGTGVAVLWLKSEEDSQEAVPMRSFGIAEDESRALGAMLLPHAADALARGAGPARLAAWAEAGVDEARAALERGLAVLAPVPAHGRLVGAIALGPRLAGEAYGALDLEYLSAAAGMVGVAIENARLYHRVFESNRQLRESNRRLAELDRLKNEFLQNVNHELRTPLAVIVAYLDILHQAGTLDENGRQAVTASIAQADKLEGLVENLLDFSELEADTLELELGPCDLASLLVGYAQGRQPGVADGLREFTLEIELDLPQVTCDARRLVQVLDELVDNAIKFTPPGSRIAMRAVRRRDGDADRVAVEVEDDGPGIDQGTLATLFEAFRQGDGSTTREAGGMGLGLALARQIAERMGGRLVAESRVGEGSTFGLLLPTA